MSKWKLEQWCVYAAHGVRYLPDRKEVYKELRQHVDDRFEDFTAQGETEEEAVEHTLNAMGDAQEVAALLAQVHRPFWGYLYSTAKWIVIVMVCVCLLYLPYYLNHTHYYKYDRPKVEEWTDGYARGDEQVLYAQPGTSITCDGYTVTLTDVALWRTWMDEGNHDTMEELVFQLKVTNPRPWAQTPDVMNWISAEDSNGNYYYCRAEQLFSTVSENRMLYGNRYRTGLCTTLYRMHVGWHLPEGTEWVDLKYTRDGRDWKIRIDLTGGNDA